MTQPNYAELVAQAEKAVDAVNNPELKRVAFEKILDDLLAGGQQEPEPRARATEKKAATAAAAPRAKAKRGGPQAYVEELIADEFFKKPKTIAEVKAELQNRGHHIPLTSLSGPMQKLCQKKTLRRQKSSIQGKKGMKQAFTYSHW